MSNKRFSIRSRIRNFKNAFAGLVHLIRNEHNAWIHLLAAVLVIILGFITELSTPEWLFITLAIALVFTAELINSAIERMVDLLSPDKHKLAKQAKDLGAAAVLVASITALVIGILIFGPKLFGS